MRLEVARFLSDFQAFKYDGLDVKPSLVVSQDTSYVLSIRSDQGAEEHDNASEEHDAEKKEEDDQDSICCICQVQTNCRDYHFECVAAVYDIVNIVTSFQYIVAT